MENQNIAALTEIDLSAAFNTVDHSILLDVLVVKFGIAGTARFFQLLTRTLKVTKLSFLLPTGMCKLLTYILKAITRTFKLRNQWFFVVFLLACIFKLDIFFKIF